MFLYALLYLAQHPIETPPYSPWLFYFIGTAQVQNERMQNIGEPYRVFAKTVYDPEQGTILNINGRGILGAGQSTFDGISTLSRMGHTNSFKESINQNNELSEGVVMMEGAEWNWSSYRIQRFLKNGEYQIIEANIDGSVSIRVKWFNNTGKSHVNVFAHYYPTTEKDYERAVREIISSRKHAVIGQ